jgi:hypothetical protein
VLTNVYLGNLHEGIVHAVERYFFAAYLYGLFFGHSYIVRKPNYNVKAFFRTPTKKVPFAQAPAEP